MIAVINASVWPKVVWPLGKAELVVSVAVIVAANGSMRVGATWNGRESPFGFCDRGTMP